jgi:hypothetical protein
VLPTGGRAQNTPTVLDEANVWQVEEVMAVLSEGPEGFYG